MTRGRYTYEITRTITDNDNEFSVLIIMTNDSHQDIDTFDRIGQIRDVLIKDGYTDEDIFISLEVLDSLTK